MHIQYDLYGPAQALMWPRLGTWTPVSEKNKIYSLVVPSLIIIIIYSFCSEVEKKIFLEFIEDFTYLTSKLCTFGKFLLSLPYIFD